MVVAITALDVAFMSSIAALLASVTAPLAALAVARLTSKHERSLAREERGFEARRVAFEETLTEAANDVFYARQKVAEARDGKFKITAPGTDGTMEPTTVREWSQGRARIATLGSGPVMVAFERHASAQAEFWTRVVRLTSAGNVGEVLDPARADELQQLLDDVHAARLALEEQVRVDLRGARS